MKIKSIRAIIQLIIVLVLGGITYFWLYKYNGVEQIELIKQKIGSLLLVLTIPVQVLLSVTPFPSEVFAFGSSLLLGFWLGFLNNWIAWTISAFVEYRMVRIADSNIIINPDKKIKFPKWLQRFPIDSPIFLICGLWLPFGSHIVIISAALAKVNIKKLLICAAIGYIPLSLIISGMANGLLNFFN